MIPKIRGRGSINELRSCLTRIIPVSTADTSTAAYIISISARENIRDIVVSVPHRFVPSSS